MRRHDQGLPRVGDLVRIKQHGGSLSEQRYEVATVGPRTRCTIRQWPSTAPKGKRMAEELFDTTLLVVDNSGPELLAKLFPFGGSR
jgi:hypothetical protein